MSNAHDKIDFIKKANIDKIPDWTNQVHLWNRKCPSDFEGNISEWYKTLLMKIYEISSGGDIITSPEIGSIFEICFDFKTNFNATDSFQKNIGAFTYKRELWNIYIDPYFLCNKILINPGTLNEKEIVVVNLRGS